MNSENRPQVGVAVFVCKADKILLLKRKNAHGTGSWGLPGGHLEFNEELEECAEREVQEEAGIYIKNIRFSAITNDIFFDEGKHYLTVFMIADYLKGDATIREPEKCEEMGWFSWDKLPSPLFLPLQNLLKRDYSPFV